MRWLYKLPRRLRSIFRKTRVEQELTDELRFHLEKLAEEERAKGMTAEDARYVALRRLGGIEQIKEECRDLRGVNYIENLFQDLRYGLRMLAKSPGFSAVAVLTLAVGIASNTALFTVVNTVLLRPLPYPDAGRIVDIFRQDRTADSLPMFSYWQQNNPCFDDLTAYGVRASRVNLRGGDRPELVRTLRVSTNYFRLFGANPILGRGFTSQENQLGGPEALVMSYGLWQGRFGRDPSILGKTITLGGAPYTVVGVLSPNFRPYPPTDVWIPLQADSSSTDQAHVLMVSGRLRSGTTLAQANSQMAVIGKRYSQAHPEQLGNDDKLTVTPMLQEITGDIRPDLLILLGAVGLVLLIACANVANLLLARSTGRQREIAVRAAIGAGGGRIVRQLLTESLLLGLAGGTLGLALGSWGVRALILLSRVDLAMYQRFQEVARVPALDSGVAGFTALVSIMTAVLFGLFPALQLSRTDLLSSLKGSSGYATIGMRHTRLRNALAAAEVGVAVVLLCGAVLLIRSLAVLHSVQPGFDPQNLLTLKVSLAGSEYARGADIDRLGRKILDRIDRIPGVESAAMANSLPFGAISDMIFNIPGRPPLKGYKFTGDVLWCFVSPSYFETLRIPLRGGRLFRDQEPSHAVIISEAMARKFWPNENPVGQSIIIGAGLGPKIEQGPTQIVGVVGDVHYRLDSDAPAVMYQLYSHISDEGVRLTSQLQPAGIAIRTKPRVAPLSVSQATQETLLARDTQLPATAVQTMEQVMLDSTAETNFNLLLFGVFAGIALLLAVVGIYGVMAYTVEQRTHEIGIRTALGARREHMLKLVVGQGLKMTLVGLGIGVAAALALTRFLASLLYGVKPTDPLTMIAVSIILTATALLACYIPARRATKIDPMVALRYE
ncbi:MAG TPA: ABC transporter permease [Terriglobia bacterium]|nr:ABC transporter permease [Terriglobia bacterium]